MTVLHLLPALLQAADPNLPPVSGMAFFIFTIVKILIIFTIYMVGVAMLTLAERKISAWIQDRHGPNRVGKGWLQPAADGLKNFMKEETMPAGVNRPLFVLAPALSFIPALTTWCVIPFGAPVPTRWGRIDLVVAERSNRMGQASWRLYGIPVVSRRTRHPSLVRAARRARHPGGTRRLFRDAVTYEGRIRR